MFVGDGKHTEKVITKCWSRLKTVLIFLSGAIIYSVKYFSLKLRYSCIT